VPDERARGEICLRLISFLIHFFLFLLIGICIGEFEAHFHLGSNYLSLLRMAKEVPEEAG
jgi:hypothetical protein